MEKAKSKVFSPLWMSRCCVFQNTFSHVVVGFFFVLGRRGGGSWMWKSIRICKCIVRCGRQPSSSHFTFLGAQLFGVLSWSITVEETHRELSVEKKRKNNMKLADFSGYISPFMLLCSLVHSRLPVLCVLLKLLRVTYVKIVPNELSSLFTYKLI